MKKAVKTIIFILIYMNICIFNKLYSQNLGVAIFQFKNGFIYGKGDSLNCSGSISITKDSLFLKMKDKVTEKEINQSIAISKFEHNKKEELDQLNSKNSFSPSLLSNLKLTYCNEIFDIYTEDKSDWLFLFANNLTYLVFHNNFVLINFIISSGDYLLLKSIFPNL